jgi:hypothetical protein
MTCKRLLKWVVRSGYPISDAARSLLYSNRHIVDVLRATQAEELHKAYIHSLGFDAAEIYTPCYTIEDGVIWYFDGERYINQFNETR